MERNRAVKRKKTTTVPLQSKTPATKSPLNEAKADQRGAEGKTALHKAAEKGHIREVEQLLAQKADCNAKNNKGGTPLHAAAFNGHADLCRILVTAGAHIHEVNNFGNTALHLAALQGHIEVCTVLLECGIDPTSRNDKGHTAAEVAHQSKQSGVAQLLREHNVPNASPKEKAHSKKPTPKKEVDINAQDELGVTRLHRAAENANLTEVHTCLSLGADVNLTTKKGATPLHLAVILAEKAPKVVQALLDAGASPNSKDSDGHVPLNIVMQGFTRSSLPLAKMLLDGGTDPNTGEESMHNDALLWKAAEKCGPTDNEFSELVALLIAKGANIYRKRLIYNTPWNYAIAKEKIALLKVLLPHHPDLLSHKTTLKIAQGSIPENVLKRPVEKALLKGSQNMGRLLVQATDSSGQTYLHKAVSGKKVNKELCEKLLELGAHVNALDKQGLSPLQVWLRRGLSTVYDDSILRLFISKGAQFKAVDDLGNTLLHDAVYYSSYAKVMGPIIRTLLENGVDVKKKNNAGRTSLHTAAYLSYDKKELGDTEEFFELLIKSGASVFEIDAEGNRPLHIAAKNRCTPMVRFFLRHASDVAVTNKAGKTPLDLAREENAHEVVRVLEEYERALSKTKPAKLDTDANQWTPLHHAAHKGDLNSCKKLVKKASLVQAKDIWGFTPLHLAAQAGHLDVCKLLLEKKANINEGYRACGTPLFLACKQGHKQIVEFLVAKGADVHIVNSSGKTPLHEAIEHEDVVRLLLSKGAAANAMDNNGWTPLHKCSKEAVAKQLIEKGCNINAPGGPLGRTPLQCFGALNSTGYLEFLLSKGADPRALDTEGTSALHLVVTRKNRASVSALIAKGAQVNAQDAHGKTALHKAAGKENALDILELLLAQGADLKARDNLGETALHKAAAKNKPKNSLEFLLARGADLEARDSLGQTALHKAALCSRGAQSVRLLLSKGARKDARDKRGFTPYDYADYGVASLGNKEEKELLKVKK